MTTYEIDWEYNYFEKALREGFDYTYCWYMILLKHKGLKMLARPELVYIGMTDKQSVSERLMGNHKGLQSAVRDFDNRDVVIALGSWIGGGRTKNQKSISSGVIKDIEAAMIAEFKPRLNGVGVKKYTGKKIKIISGCEDDPEWDVLNWEIEYD